MKSRGLILASAGLIPGSTAPYAVHFFRSLQDDRAPVVRLSDEPAFNESSILSEDIAVCRRARGEIMEREAARTRLYHSNGEMTKEVISDIEFLNTHSVESDFDLLLRACNFQNPHMAAEESIPVYRVTVRPPSEE